MDFYEKASSQQIVSSLDVHISNSKVFMDTNALPCLGSYILHGGSDVDMVKKYNLFMSYFVKWLDNDNLVILPRVSQEMNARLCYSVRNVKNIDETAEVRTYLDLVEKVKFKLSDKYFSSFIGFEEGLKLLEEANILMSWQKHNHKHGCADDQIEVAAVLNSVYNQHNCKIYTRDDGLVESVLKWFRLLKSRSGFANRFEAGIDIHCYSVTCFELVSTTNSFIKSGTLSVFKKIEEKEKIPNKKKLAKLEKKVDIFLELVKEQIDNPKMILFGKRVAL